MRIAETTRSRSLVVLTTVATLSLIVTAWATAPAPVASARAKVRPMRACGEMIKQAAAAPLPAPQHNSYADTLIAARESLTACMKHQAVDVRLSIEISEAGRATSIEVKALTDDLAKLDMHVVKCLDQAVSPLEFPHGPAPLRVSTHLSAQR